MKLQSEQLAWSPNECNRFAMLSLLDSVEIIPEFLYFQVRKFGGPTWGSRVGAGRNQNRG